MPGDLPLWPSASAGNCTGADSEAERPGRDTGRIPAGEGRGNERPGLQSKSKAGQGAGRCLTVL